MKIILNIAASILMLLASVTVTNAQSAKAQKFTIKLPTIACESCKSTIENSCWKQVDGLLAIDVRVKQKYAKVTLLTDRTSLDNLRLYIADLGYDADEEKADPEAIKKLTKECRAHLLAPPPPAKGAVSDTLRVVPKKTRK